MPSGAKRRLFWFDRRTGSSVTVKPGTSMWTTGSLVAAIDAERMDPATKASSPRTSRRDDTSGRYAETARRKGGNGGTKGKTRSGERVG